MKSLRKTIKSWFKPKHPYAPIAYMGRKTFERTMDCKVTKLKHLQQEKQN